MNKLPKCPKCGSSNGISCIKPVKGINSMKFEFAYYLCGTCDNEWNPHDDEPERVVFT